MNTSKERHAKLLGHNSEEVRTLVSLIHARFFQTVFEVLLYYYSASISALDKTIFELFA